MPRQLLEAFILLIVFHVMEDALCLRTEAFSGTFKAPPDPDVFTSIQPSPLTPYSVLQRSTTTTAEPHSSFTSHSPQKPNSRSPSSISQKIVSPSFSAHKRHNIALLSQMLEVNSNYRSRLGRREGTGHSNGDINDAGGSLYRTNGHEDSGSADYPLTIQNMTISHRTVFSTAYNGLLNYPSLNCSMKNNFSDSRHNLSGAATRFPRQPVRRRRTYPRKIPLPSRTGQNYNIDQKHHTFLAPDNTKTDIKGNEPKPNKPWARSQFRRRNSSEDSKFDGMVSSYDSQYSKLKLRSRPNSGQLNDTLGSIEKPSERQPASPWRSGKIRLYRHSDVHGDRPDAATIIVKDLSNSETEWCEASYKQYFNMLIRLNCTGEQFTDVPPNVRFFVPDVEYMRLQGSNFQRFSQLVVNTSAIKALHIYIEDSNVTDVSDVFRIFNSKFLVTLKLRNNSIRTMDGLTFADLRGLEHLDLSFCDISDISQEAMSVLKNLKDLTLRNNQIRELKENVFVNNSNLQELHLDYNNITSIDRGAFNGLRELLSLYLSGNNLSQAFLGSTVMFEPCIQLKTLSLNNCQISVVHAESFTGLEHLEQIDLSSNQLTHIAPDTFRKLRHLSSIFSRGLFYQCLTRECDGSDCRNLEKNGLRVVSRLWGLPQTLRFLSVYSNQISEVEDGAFDGMDLLVVFLNSNKLQTLPTRIQLYLAARYNISLSDNPWSCDCDLIFLIQFVSGVSSIPGNNNVTCATPRRARMSSLTLTEIQCPPDKDCFGPWCSPCAHPLQRQVDGTCVCMEGTQPTQRIGFPGCIACPAHHYKINPGDEPCQPCSHGSMPTYGPAPICACAVGYYPDSLGNCRQCPNGTYKNYIGVGTCSLCDEGNSNSQHCPQTGHDTGQALDISKDSNDVVFHPREKGKNTVWLSVAAATIVFAVFTLVVLIIFGRHFKAKRRLIKRHNVKMNARSNVLRVSIEETQFSNGSSSNSVDFRCSGRHSLHIREIGNMIGRGAFGQVFEGSAYLASYDKEPTKVAIKRLKDTATDEEVKNLREELEQMLNVGAHPNIIGLYGSAFFEGHFCIVMEYAELGDLLSYLKTECTFPLQYVRVGSDGMVVEQSAPKVEDNANLMMFSWQIAKGMRHLETHRFIHRDLAARNCLLTKGPIAKVSDFGLSKDAYELGHYKRVQKDRVPFKWLSPEALLWGQYSSKSDVWAFGILLWELYTFGGTPYPQVTTEQLRELHENGYRMSKPPACPEPLYRIMRACWREDPRQRPSFKQLEQTLDCLIQKTNQKEYLDLHPHGMRTSTPLSVTKEDLDDQMTSVEFVYRNKKQTSNQSSMYYNKSLDHQNKAYASADYLNSKMVYSETFPILEVMEGKTESPNSSETTATSGFQSMTSAQTM